MKLVVATRVYFILSAALGYLSFSRQERTGQEIKNGRPFIIIFYSAR